MDNKQWKLSHYGNYSKWQQSPGYLLPHLHFFPPSDGFPCGLYKAICHSDLYSKDRQKFVLHYRITRQVDSPFSFQFVFQLQVCPRWLAAPLCPAKGR